MKTGIIIQARTGSTRLPNKILLPFFEGKGILELLIEGLLKIYNKDQVIIATSINKNDYKIVEVAESYNVLCFRGNENDVLNRFTEAAKKYKLDKIVRVCSDNPFLDFKTLKILTEQFNSFNGDYISFCDSKRRPTISLHYGLWAEAVSLSALNDVALRTQDPFYYEHVTNYIYNNPLLYNVKLIPISKKNESNNIRLTVDTIEDFNLLKDLYSKWVRKSKGKELHIDLLYSLINEDSIIQNMMKQQIKNQQK